MAHKYKAVVDRSRIDRWTEGEGPLTAVSKQDGSALAVEEAMMTQKARQLYPFCYWANSFINKVLHFLFGALLNSK